MTVEDDHAVELLNGDGGRWSCRPSVGRVHVEEKRVARAQIVWKKRVRELPAGAASMLPGALTKRQEGGMKENGRTGMGGNERGAERRGSERRESENRIAAECVV